MRLHRPLSVLLSVLASLALAGTALTADLAALVGNLTSGGLSEREAAITALAASGEERAVPILDALAAGQLYIRNSDKLVVIGKVDGNKLALSEAISAKPAGTAAPKPTAVKVAAAAPPAKAAPVLVKPAAKPARKKA